MWRVVELVVRRRGRGIRHVEGSKLQWRIRGFTKRNGQGRKGKAGGGGRAYIVDMASAEGDGLG